MENKKIKPNKKGKTRGFTLIEALVAVSILALATVGALGVAQGGLQSAFFARDQITAFYLAQEGVEFVKNQRHSNLLNDPGDNWIGGFGPGNSNACLDGWCAVDSITENVHPGDGGRPKIYIDENGFYRSAFTSSHADNQGWTDTGFERRVRVEPFRVDTQGGQQNYGAVVTSRVEWVHGGDEKDVEVVEHIFRWHEN